MPVEIDIKIQNFKAPITSHHRACTLFPCAAIISTVVTSDSLCFSAGFYLYPECLASTEGGVCSSFQFQKEAAFLPVVFLSLLQLPSLAGGSCRQVGKSSSRFSSLRSSIFKLEWIPWWSHVGFGDSKSEWLISCHSYRPILDSISCWHLVTGRNDSTGCYLSI